MFLFGILEKLIKKGRLFIFMKSYKGTVKEMKEFLDLPQIEKALSDAVDRGNRLEVIVHSNTSETLRKLLKDGKADGYYSPNPTVTNKGKSNNFLIYGFGHGFEILFNGTVQFFQNIIKFWSNRRSDFRKTRSQSYPVPTEKVDELFSMIKDGRPSEEIIGYLTS